MHLDFLPIRSAIQQMIIDLSPTRRGLVTWGPLLFAIAYQAFFIPFGCAFWG